MTVFERLKSMSSDELQTFILTVYKWGHINERCGTGDEHYYKRLMSYDSHHIDDIIRDYDLYATHLYKIKVTKCGSTGYHYVHTRFFGVDDAVEYIHKVHRVRDPFSGQALSIVKVTDRVYMHCDTIFTIEED
jgi:hypothetical protein